ncbi:UNVERIFIED_CONTAM: hypothetical protein Slati_0457800 [Sesamum latifolium]|uniref:Uncharacterized protein n=1 Tax=Sesamum latifolium TaxID=2727402 RepID=A0AAW2Y0B9_9LAMI
MAGSQSAGPSGGRRKSLRQMATAVRRLIDEEEEEVGGKEGKASSPGEEGRAARDLVAVSFIFDGLGVFDSSDSTHYSDEEGFLHPKFADNLYSRSPRPCSFHPHQLFVFFPRPSASRFELISCSANTSETMLRERRARTPLLVARPREPLLPVARKERGPNPLRPGHPLRVQPKGLGLTRWGLLL